MALAAAAAIGTRDDLSDREPILPLRAAQGPAPRPQGDAEPDAGPPAIAAVGGAEQVPLEPEPEPAPPSRLRSAPEGQRVSPDRPRREPAAGSGDAAGKPEPQRQGPPGLVLEAGFESGLDNWNTSGVGDVVPVVIDSDSRSGSHAARVTLSGGQERSELILGGDGGPGGGNFEFVEGDEYFYAFSFKVLAMVYGRPGAHNLIMQFKSEGPGSPNFGLQLWDYEGDDPGTGGRGLWSTGEGAMGTKDRFLAPVAEGLWHDVTIHFVASEADSGRYELYLDGSLIDARSGVSMIVPGRGSAYIKNGIYRNGETAPGTSVLLIDRARLGTTAESVGG